jgi:hypothetical protein
MKSHRRRLGGTLAVVSVFGLLALAPSVSATSTLMTGTYSGKTKQKAKVGFELANSATECPGSGKSKLCLYQLDNQSANIDVPCPGGTQDGVQELINPVAVPSSGVLHKSFGQIDVAGRLTYYIKVHRKGTLSGWFEESFSSGGGPVCKSGKVTLSAKRTGGLKH